jgi:hypothetical protein
MRIKLFKSFELGITIKIILLFIFLKMLKKSLISNVFLNVNFEISNQRIVVNIVTLNTNHSRIQ